CVVELLVFDSGSFIVVDFFFQAEDGIRDGHVTGVQTCALPICLVAASTSSSRLGAAVSVVVVAWAWAFAASFALMIAPPLRRPQIGRASCRERVKMPTHAVIIKTQPRDNTHTTTPTAASQPCMH